MRVYDKEFKEEAVKLSYEVRPTVASAQLGIPPTTLYTRRSQRNQHGSLAFVGSGHRGSQYTSKMYRETLTRYGAVQSMSIPEDATITPE